MQYDEGARHNYNFQYFDNGPIKKWNENLHKKTMREFDGHFWLIGKIIVKLAEDLS